MTRSYALLRLLQLGPMSLDQIVLVGGTGWDMTGTTKLVRGLCAECVLALARDARGGFCLAAPFDEALRRLRVSEQRACAPVGVAPVQPGLSGLRGAGDLLRATHAQLVREGTRRADVLPAAALAAVRAQRGGITRRRRPVLVRVGGLGK